MSAVGGTVGGPELAGPSAPDVARMRRQRGERVREAMRERGIEALILLGPANVAYATGATRSLGDACRTDAERPVALVLAEDPVPHLFTPFLADAAAELHLDDDHLHGPAFLDLAEGVEAFARSLTRLVPAMSTYAVDELNGAMRFLDEDIADAGPVLRAIRRTKTEDEVRAIRGAVAIAGAAVEEAAAQLRPGATEAELADVLRASLAARGAVPSALRDVVRITSQRDDRPAGAADVVQAGDLVAFHAGAVVEGCSGEVGRTLAVGPAAADHRVRALHDRWADLAARLVEACQPGAPASALLDAYAAAGEPLPVMPVGRGLGTGADAPVIVRHLRETAAIEQLDPGVVMMLTACAFDDSVGSVISRQAVHVTPHGPELLAELPTWTHDLAGAHP